MQPFTTVNSHVAPVPIKDVDTDMIIPAQFLTSISRDGFGEHLFSRLRSSDPNFYMNQERYEGAQILVADTNFGCGSSREHAVWALQGAGVKVVIAPSFADIFAGNSAKNGLLLITLADESVRTVLRLAQETRLALSVDLQGQTVSAKDGLQWHFDYDPFRKHCLLHGLDDLDYLRSRLGQILQKKQELKDSWFYRADIPNR